MVRRSRAVFHQFIFLSYLSIGQLKKNGLLTIYENLMTQPQKIRGFVFHGGGKKFFHQLNFEKYFNYFT